MISRISRGKSQPTVSDIRKTNRLQILHQLLLRKTSTRQELSQLTGLSTATVANLISSMLEEELVVEAGMETPDIGRPTTILTINANKGMCIGVDVAETYIHYDLYDLTLRNLAEYEVKFSSTTKKEPADVVSLIVSGFNTLLANAGIEHERIVGMGISIPGPFEHSTGVSILAPSWGWVNIPLQEMLEREIDVPLYLDNPLKFNAIAESWFGAGRGANNMAAVVLGTGVGVGLIVDGHLLHGVSNTAGEWGHSVILAGGRGCRCGKRGCLEAYVGAPGILQTLIEIDPRSSLLFAEDQPRSISAIATAASEGDLVANQVVYQTAVYLGAGLGNLINTLNPELVILGSWVAALLGPVMLPALMEQISSQTLTPSFKSVRVVLSDMTRNAVSLGAATLVLEDFFANNGERGKSLLR